MYLIVENVNEEGEVYETSEPVKPILADGSHWGELHVAVNNALKLLEEFPNDSIRIITADARKFGLYLD